MEDNERNELIENGRIHSVLRSASNRVIEKEKYVNVSIVSSKTKLRHRNVKGHISQSHHAVAHVKDGDKSEAGLDFDNIVADKSLSENGMTRNKNFHTVADQHVFNNLPIHKQNDQTTNSSNCRSSMKRSAYLFYKAAGEWWNVFPKTDYTYSKSSTCRKEIAPGVMTMPNMSRSPLHSYLGRKSMETSSPRLNRTFDKSLSGDFSDDAYNVSSTTYITTTRTSLLKRIVSSVWQFFSLVYSVLTLKKYRLGIQSTLVTRRAGHVNTISRYHLLEFMCYQSACYFLRLDAWILSLFHRSNFGHQMIEKKRESKYLFLLLIPPLLYLGLWCNSASTSPLAALSTFMSGGVNLLPSSLVQKTSTYGVEKLTNPPMDEENLDLLVQKILSSSEFKNVLLVQDFRNKEHLMYNEEMFLSSVKLEHEKLKVEFDNENKELELALAEQQKILLEHQATNERLSLEYSILIDRMEQLKIQVKSLQAHNVHLSRRVGECRKIFIQTFPKVEIEKHVSNFLHGLFDIPDAEGNNKETMKSWIKTLLIAKDNLEDHLAETMTIVNKRIEEATGKSAETLMASISDMMKEEFLKQEKKLHADTIKYISVTGETISANSCDGCSLSIDKVKEIVNNALHLYDADKTGMVDYALESAGGTVINIRCTENYNERSLALSFLGMTFPWSSNHPRIALQPEIHPGKCWAFRGAQGYLVIRLAKRIKVSAFSIEHIPVSISHAGNVDAAPKNFSVRGLNNETDREPVLLGKYMYQATGPPLQIFPVQNEEAPPYQIVELAIESNHGNLEYTCLYRFRVHGIVI
ncbi:hypothetical protein R5R35_013077 [Gryllus longicercus]|uniref:SUN domain-containing protein n=1 Tax=Gryllus longicercus TaxID=2509291 RepID=A0AAN9UZD6_9ORTH